MPKSCCNNPGDFTEYQSIINAALRVWRKSGGFDCIKIDLNLTYNGFDWTGTAGPLTVNFECSGPNQGTGSFSYNNPPCVASDSTSYSQGTCLGGLMWAWGTDNVFPMITCCGQPQSEMAQEIMIWQGPPIPTSVSIDHVPCEPATPDSCPCADHTGGGGCSGSSFCLPYPPIFSTAPVRYATGELSLVETDISSSGFGLKWGHTRSFRNRSSLVQTLGQGFNWQVAEWQHLVVQYGGTVVVMGEFGSELWFDKSGSTYVARFGRSQRLTLDTAAQRYRLTEINGTVTEFDSVTGMFRKKFDPFGNVIAVTALHANGYNLTQVERSSTSGGTTTTEQFAYDYQKISGDQMVQAVTLRRRVGAGAWENVTKAEYAYYTADETHGMAGDLKTVTTSIWSAGAWSATGTSYYRYWIDSASSSSSSSSSSSGASGTPWGPQAHQLKYALKPSAFQRLSADPSVSDPFTASDAIVSLYADYYFEYDAERL